MRTPGWTILKELANAQLDLKRKRLEKCMNWELDKIQGYIEGIKFPFDKIEQLIKDNNTGQNNAS